MAYETFTRKAPKIIADLMGDFPLDSESAAAILGNLGHESGGLVLLQEISPTVKGSRGGFGWAQWTGPRRRAFEAWVKAKGYAPASDEANYGFLREELKGSYKRAIPAVIKAKGIESKVRVFEEIYEGAGVKNYPSRIKYANLALKAYRDAPAIVRPGPVILPENPAPRPPPDVPAPEPQTEPANPGGFFNGLLRLLKLLFG